MKAPLLASVSNLLIGLDGGRGQILFNSKARSGVFELNAGYKTRAAPLRGNQMVTKKTNLPPFLSLHTIAAIRGDGLHPGLLALFKRLAADVDGNLAEVAEPPVGCEIRSEEK